MLQSSKRRKFEVTNVCDVMNFNDDSNHEHKNAIHEEINTEWEHSLLMSLFPRKKRHRDRRIRLVPRLLQADLRRYYAQMLVNSLNSHDDHFLRHFLLHYGDSRLSMSKTCTIHTSPGDRKSHGLHLELHGIQNIADYWSLMHHLLPDEVVVAKDVQVIRHKDDEGHKAKIVMQFEASATITFDATPPIYAFQKVQYSNALNKLNNLPTHHTTTTTTTTTMSDTMVDSLSLVSMPANDISCSVSDEVPANMKPTILSEANTNLKPLSKPRPSRLTGTCTIYVGADRRLENLTFSNGIYFD